MKPYPPPRSHLRDSPTAYSFTSGRDLDLVLDSPPSSPPPTTEVPGSLPTALTQASTSSLPKVPASAPSLVSGLQYCLLPSTTTQRPERPS